MPMPPPPRAARGMGYDKGLGAGLAARDLSSALTATRAAAGGPLNPRGDGLYGELYGWVPRDLVNASPAKLVRALVFFAPAAVDGDMTLDRADAFATVSAGPVGATVDVAMDHACWDCVGAAAPEARWGGAPPGGVVEAADEL